VKANGYANRKKKKTHVICCPYLGLNDSLADFFTGSLPVDPVIDFAIIASTIIHKKSADVSHGMYGVSYKGVAVCQYAGNTFTYHKQDIDDK